MLADLGERFAPRYHDVVEAVAARGLPLVLCTIYEGAFPDPAMQRLLRVALGAFNDVIVRAAFARGLPLIDLRAVCDEPGDYANPIEPSVQGGGKIARAIARALVGPAPGERRTTVVTGRPVVGA
jgi:hypothetical protein